VRGYQYISIIGSLAILALAWNHYSGTTSEFDTGKPTSGITRTVSKAPVLRDISRRLASVEKKERPAVMAEGVRIATERLARLSELAKTNPSRALSAMMPLHEIAALPPEIRAVSEQPFSAIGSIDLRWKTSILPDGSLECKHENLAMVGDKSWQVLGPDFRDAHAPMTGVPLDGYVIGDILLLEENGVRKLSAEDARVSSEFFPDADAMATDPVTGGRTDGTTFAVIGGKVRGFGNPAILDHVIETLAEADLTMEKTDSRQMEHGFYWLEADAGVPGTLQAGVLAAPPNGTPLKVLFVRVNFLDNPLVEPVTQSKLETDLDTVSTRIQEFSYGQSSLDFTVTSELYTLPLSGVLMATTGNNDAIINAAQNAAGADYDLTSFDVVAVYFPNLSGVPLSQIRYGGQASVGGANHWINGVSDFGRLSVIIHEFGHNYGLFHANYFDPGKLIGGEYYDPSQVSREYGDIFDRMGEGSAETGYFSPYASSRINWMPEGKIIEPTASGTWRVYRFDQPSATTNPLLTLRVPMGGNRYNWVGLRELQTSLKSKAYIVGEGIYANRPNLIDATPDSASPETADRADAGLPVGQSFYDAGGGVRFTNMAAGGTDPNQWIDVKIDFDPRLQFASSSVVVDEAGGNAVLSVTRGFDSSSDCSVSYSTTGGPATSGTDFLSTSGSVSWAAGDGSPKSIFIPIRPDSTSEGPESFTVTLSGGTNAVVVDAAKTATVTIVDAGNRVPTFNPPFFNTTVNAVEILDDGKIIVGGNLTSGVIAHIARFNADGSEDTTFVKGSGFNGTVNTLLRQTDGKIIVGGDFTSYNGTTCGRITRLNSNGTIDSGFNNALGIGANSTVKAIAMEQSGCILVGGAFTTFSGSTVQGLVRLSSTGAMLNTLTTAFRAGTTSINAILPESNGKIMVVGALSFDFVQTFGFRFGIARLNSSGARDITFEPGYGTHYADGTINGNPQDGRFVNGGAEAIIQLPNGNYLVGGGFTRYNQSVARRIACLLPSGAFDTFFTPPSLENGQGDGVFVNQGVMSLRVMPSGSIAVGGFFTSPAGKVIALQSSGAIATNINLAGGTTGSSVRAFATDSSGSLYVAGNFFNFGGSTSRPIVKLAGGLDAITLWKNSTFTAAQITAGNTGTEEDFDNDGILNITEMAIGTSPTVPDSPTRFAVAAGNLSLQTASSSQFLMATMERSAQNTGVWLVAQFSSDLTNWSPALPTPGSNATYDVMENTGTRFTVRDKTPSAPGVNRFVRFRAVAPN